LDHVEVTDLDGPPTASIGADIERIAEIDAASHAREQYERRWGDDVTVSDLDAWDARTRDLLEKAYVGAGDGPRGSGSGHASVGDWRAKRQHLAIPMDRDGSWLDVGCANGFLLVTLPSWCAERGVTIDPYGLELLPKVADLARALHPDLADRIWTGSVMAWTSPRRFTYVTALADQVPPDRLGDLVGRLLDRFVEPGGRLIISAYTDPGEVPRDLFADLTACGHVPTGRIHIDRPRRHPLITAWLDP
jgi:hypothetical protein